MIDPIKIVDTLQPQKIKEPKPGIFVYDFGQNAARWTKLLVKGERGRQVKLMFSENLAADGTVNQQNLIKAAATDVYILKGGEEEVWEPRFTYHGFRYVQIEGFPGRPQPQSLKMIWWTEASNLYSVPTDCPQRSERMG